MVIGNGDVPIAVELSLQFSAFCACSYVFTQMFAGWLDALEYLANSVRTLVLQDPPEGVAAESRTAA